MTSIIEEGEFSLFYFNRTYSHTILKTPESGDFRVQEEHGGRIISVTPEQKALQCAMEVLETLNVSLLYARIDLVREETGDYALMELELIEPSLYFRMDPIASTRFAQALAEMVSHNG